MAYTYQSFATLGVNLNRQNYGALDISQVFNSQGDLNYYLSKGTDKSAVSNYWKDIVPYPYEGQVLATVFGGEVKVYVLALNAEGKFVCQNVGDTSAVEAAIAELEEALEALDGKVGAIPTKEVDGQQVPVAANVIEYINEKTKGIATDAALGELQDAVDAVEKSVEDLEKAVSDEEARALAAEKALGERIDGIDFVDEDELAEALKPYAKSADVVAKSDYATDKAALEAEDSAIRAIAEGARDTINTFLNSQEVDDTVNTLKEIQAEIAKMTDATELAQALASKADTSYVNDELAKKQDVIAENTYDAYGSAEAAKEAAISAAASDATSKANQALADAKADAEAKYAAKATTLAGYGITDAYTKAETDKAIADKVADVTGGESAAAVKLLLEAEVTRSTDKDNAHDLAIETINDKLDGVEAGAQVNKIEVVKVNGTALTITDKAVDVIVPTDYLTSADRTSLTGLISTAQAKADDAAAAASTNAGAITTLSGTVSDQGDLIGQHATAIDALQKSLAESGAVGSKIATLENSAKSHDDAIVAINNTLATKADASALDSYLLTSAFDTKIADYYKKTEVEAILGNRGDKDIVTLINEAKTAATYDDTKVKEDIAANAKAISDETTRALAAEKANADEIARVNGVLVDAIENNAEGLDSIKELADWINNHGTTVTGLTEAIEKNAEDILANANAIKTINETTIPALEEEVKAYADTAVTNFAASEFIFNGGTASTNLWTEAAAE